MVDVSLEKGLASVKMKPGNTATFKKLQEAITKNGFTMKPSYVTVAGTIVLVNGQPQLLVSGSNDSVSLIPNTSNPADYATLASKKVIVEGMLDEAAKGKSINTIHYDSIKEDK